MELTVVVKEAAVAVVITLVAPKDIETLLVALHHLSVGIVVLIVVAVLLITVDLDI